MIIEEGEIDQIIDKLEENKDFSSSVQNDFHKHQEDYAFYLQNEILDILTPVERDLLLFIHYVFTAVIMSKFGKYTTIELPKLFSLEEKLWEVFENQSKKTFREKLTPFFEAYPQYEDAFAFIEDLLIEPEEEQDVQISKEGRDVIWVSACSYIMAL